MRTLKKTLAFVLVLAMVLSLGTIGASAAFTDTDSSEYGVAIDVLSGIGVIDGMGDGTFDPAGSLTREQAAKIIAYMLLGPANAKLISSATSQKFSDVAKDRWSAGYIEYCANLGIIAGVGDGKFDPTGVLTTSAFTKMVLCALGYKADVEGLVGESWAINTASLAVTAGITDPAITISPIIACTREQACQIAFKALTANMVTYTGGSTMTVGGVTITTGATRKDVDGSKTVNYDGKAGDGVMQFCESKFPSLKLSSSEDAFGRVLNVWKLGQTVLSSTGAKTPVLTYTENMKGAPALKKIRSDTKNLVLPTGADAIKAVVNGVPAKNYLDSFDGNENDGDLAYLTGNGVKVEIYAVDGVVTEVVVTEETLATIKKIDTKNEKITVAYGGCTTVVDSEDKFYSELSEFAVNDYVLVALDDPENDGATVLSVAEPETITGKYTAKNTILDTYTVGGTVYKAADGVTVSGLPLGSSCTLIFDSYGYIMKAVAGIIATSDYAYVLAASRDGTAKTGYTYSAQLLYTDGSKEWVDVSSVDSVPVAVAPPAGFSDGKYAGKFVTFEEDDGSYAITKASTLVAGKSGAITKGTPTIFDTYTATNSTVFLIADKDGVYTAYTGIKNVPSINVAEDKADLLCTGTVAKIVVVKTGAATSSGKAVFLYNSKPVGGAVIAGTTVTYFKAIVNGEITTVAVDDAELPADLDTLVLGLYDNVVYTGDYISDLGNPADKITGVTHASLDFGLLTLTRTDADPSEHVVADGFVAFAVDLTAGTAAEADLPATADGKDCYITQDIDKYVTALYIVTPAPSSSET